MITAVAWVKDEADIIEQTVRNMAAQVDRVVVADQRSADGTRDILEQLASEIGVVVVDDDEPGFHQSRITTRLARQAIDGGAEYVVPFDADELWLGLDVWDRSPGVWAVPVFSHVPTLADDWTVSCPVLRQRWRRREPKDPKVMFSAARRVTVEFGNHGVVGRRAREVEGVTIRHFPSRSVDQFVAKVERGIAGQPDRDRAEWYGSHWSKMVDPANIFAQTIMRADPGNDPLLICDPAR